MSGGHIAFFLDQAYGNTVPSFAIAMELIRRGHRVSYIVTESFAPLIRSIGATPIVINFLEIRKTALSEMAQNAHSDDQAAREYYRTRAQQLIEERTRHALVQLDRLLARPSDPWRPDLVVHDDSFDRTGRELALKLGLPKVRLATQFIDERYVDFYAHDETIVITVPEFFQERVEWFKADPRFHFVGFSPEGRCLPFRPWTALEGDQPRVLVSPTSGLLQQIDFCTRMVEVFRDQPLDVILSISASQDTLSDFDPKVLGELPSNIHINRHAGNFEILQNVDLFIGQAGQGGALEAIYWGRPQILLPPTSYHHHVARRVSELGLGICLPVAQMSRASLLPHVATCLNDAKMQARIREAGTSMRGRSGAELAANIIERPLR
jgi:UDP:flavonoid glycosyltransferase YjiC (YdhE family)